MVAMPATSILRFVRKVLRRRPRGRRDQGETEIERLTSGALKLRDL
jgi:hypothetical protein